MGKRFILLLVILFFASFWYAGGHNLINLVIPSSKQAEQTMTSLGSGWDKFYRVIALKTAVNKRLDKKNYVLLKDIPLTMQQAIISVEDNRYYRHVGFDIEGILRATLVNLQTGTIVEGGSTITQQLVRNLFLTHDRSVSRKVEEIVLAVDMELRFTKEEILEMYLNSVYYGSGTYGIGPASKGYFGKEPAKLNLAESSMLAGLPNAPSLISPYVNLSAAKERQAVVLSTMVKNGYIGPSLAEEAKQTILRFVKQ
ncbi:Monofunctional biosynthetic peptidoglycan transglycosylase [bioreactor metagenome]|uniref:peptidoglycan glycosyltransferase n=1 Tax=bioreactor metagenome TaxID=1076179 RepID=A0A644TMK8_9ZZZZ|nr:transglycosylase domain-containing protein [Negativicutes bacterium]